MHPRGGLADGQLVGNNCLFEARGCGRRFGHILLLLLVSGDRATPWQLFWQGSALQAGQGYCGLANLILPDQLNFDAVFTS